MRFKVVPPAPDPHDAVDASAESDAPEASTALDRLREVHGAVPLVPNDEESCCARLVADVPVPSQDAAKEWLTFLRALGLAAEGDRGYSRVRSDPDRVALAAAFRENVYAAEEALVVLREAEDPLSAEQVFDRLRDRVPAWERQRDAGWETVWTERVGRILDWAVPLGLAERTTDGYVAVEDGD